MAGGRRRSRVCHLAVEKVLRDFFHGQIASQAPNQTLAQTAGASRLFECPRSSAPPLPGSASRTRREPEQMKNRTIIVLAFGLLATSPSACHADEIESLQGTWESRFQEQGRVLRVLKTIEKNRETFETSDGDTLVHRHVVTLDERQAEGITVMHYDEPEGTHGPGKGQRGKPGSFVSKRLGDTWYNIQGLDTGGDAPLTVIQFTRVAEAR